MDLALAALARRFAPSTEHNVPPGVLGTAGAGLTDGLVERPGESIDAGLAKLAEPAYELHDDIDLNAWCESTIARLVGTDARDDTALFCIRFED